MSAIDPIIPVLEDRYARAWPASDQGPSAKYIRASVALTRAFATDAHFAAYSVPSLRRRLSLDAAEHLDAVSMRLLVFDVDSAAAHANGVPATRGWWAGQLRRIDALVADQGRCFVARTRGGYRVVFVLDPPVIIRSRSDADAWKRRYYLAACVAARSGVIVDPNCAAWTQLFRLPRATRDGCCPLVETVGDADNIATWSPALLGERECRSIAEATAKTHPAWSRVVRHFESGDPPSVRPRGPLYGGYGGSRAYVVGALRRGLEVVAGAPRLQRNDTLNREAYKLARFVRAGDLPEEELVERLLAAAHRSGLGDAEARATIASAIRARRREEP